MKYCPRCQRKYPKETHFCLEDGGFLSLPDPYQLVGRTLADKFRIEALAGLGGMGAVYSAHHLAIDRRIAFKILQPNLALGNEQMLTLFEDEAKIAGRVTHENIAVVMDAGRTSEGIAYIVMEWLQGRTLAEEIAESGKLSFARTAELLRQIAAALDAAHQKNIVHRDLKPANIMLVKHPGGGEQVKVLDFGIGKVISENNDALVSQVIGTPHYSSPEQLRVGKAIDRRSDLYSLGVMLYQMLTGSVPFNAASVIEVFKMHLAAAPPLLRGERPDAPAELEQLINRLLAKNPHERPGQAGELARLFEQACATIDKTQTGPIQTQPTQSLSSSPTVTSTEAGSSDWPPSDREAQQVWEQRIEIARQKGHLEDILLLAEEAPGWEQRFAAYRMAGNAALKLGNFSLALEQYEKALRLNPGDLECRRQKGVSLGRLKRREEAKDWLENLVKEHPNDAHTWGLIGRIKKEEWIDVWRKEESAPEQIRSGAAASAGLLQKSIEAYLTGFYLDPGDYYPGINALTLLRLLEHLTGGVEFLDEQAILPGGVRWAIHCALKRDPEDYWARATFGEFAVLTGEKSLVEDAWQKAVAAANGNRFALGSSHQQILLLRDCGFRPVAVQAAQTIVAQALHEIQSSDHLERFHDGN